LLHAKYLGESLIELSLKKMKMKEKGTGGKQYFPGNQ